MANITTAIKYDVAFSFVLAYIELTLTCAKGQLGH